MKIPWTKHCIAAIVLFFLMSGPVSAAVKISAMPQPPPTAKLRIFVVVVTTEFKFTKRPVSWLVSPEAFEKFNKRLINQKLKQLGIYEIVNDADIRVVLGDQTVSNREWKAKDWALARNAGKALHADYVMIFERSQQLHLEFDTKLVNLNSGKQFEASGYIPSAMSQYMTQDQKKQAGAEVVKIHYRKIFQDAKGDLLQTAILKGKFAAQQPAASQPDTGLSIKTSPAPQHRKEDTVSARKDEPVKTSPAPSENAPKTLARPASPETGTENRKISEKQAAFEKELEKALSAKDKKSNSPRLVVYDFEAVEPMKVVGLILTEALREALYNSGGFILVNRENILKIMDEYKLQESGAVDEAQAIKMGKWLAASEAVTGNLATLGATSILQVKRIDIKTLGTIALGSLKCPVGQEDELLGQMPVLAKKLSPSAK